MRVYQLTNERFVNLFELEYEHQGQLRKWIFASRQREPDPSQPPPVVAVVVVATVEVEGVRRLVCTKEYRPVIGGYEYGFCAGLLNPGENPAESAIRELREETGLTVKRVLRISPPIISSAGLSDESVQMVFVEAEGDVSRLHLDVGEDIDTFLLDYQQVCNLCYRREEFQDVIIAAKAWPILYMYQQLGHL